MCDVSYDECIHFAMCIGTVERTTLINIVDILYNYCHVLSRDSTYSPVFTHANTFRKYA